MTPDHPPKIAAVSPATGYPPGPSYRSRLRNPGLLRLSTHEFLESNARKYGDLVHFSAFGRHVFQFNHPEMVSEVLIRDASFHHRGIVMQRARFALGEGLLTSEDPLHLRQRRLVQPAFHRERIAGYGAAMLEFARAMTTEWADHSVLDLHQQMLQLTLRIAGKCFFDTDVKADVQTISDAVTAFMGFLPLAFLPYPDLILRLPVGFIRRIRTAQRKLDDRMYSLIAERRRSGRDHGDLLSMLLASVDEEEGTGGMTDRQVRDECLTLLLAGHETTANGLSFCGFLLAQNPEIQERVHAEANAALQSGGNASEIYERLPYTRRVAAEALRIFPPVWVTARTSAKTYEYRGMQIPKGSLLLTPQIVMHRDARFYGDPLRFDPDRFLPENTAARPRYSYFPFGAGSRMCIGEGFAWMEMVLVLATMLREWRLTPAPGMSRELALSAQISLRAKHGVRLEFTRR